MGGVKIVNKKKEDWYIDCIILLEWRKNFLLVILLLSHPITAMAQ